ncbi:MAG TPA: GNAT family N-acetyltransferase [Thermoflexales bacterium]|nr:GNAT family N-acetyltransferase [Thermoflexales bacterium]
MTPTTHLIPMREEEFERYLARAIQDYAQENIKSGDWDSSDALDKSREAFGKLLPNGVASPKQHLFTAIDEESGAKVGLIWFAERDAPAGKTAFIYDFLVYEPFRGKGFGKKILAALEEQVRKLGIKTITLHAFGHNQAAIRLYQKTGYETTHVVMSKELSQS